MKGEGLEEWLSWKAVAGLSLYPKEKELKDVRRKRAAIVRETGTGGSIECILFFQLQTNITDL